MKNFCNFVASSTETILLTTGIVALLFVPSQALNAATNRLSIPNSCYTSELVIVSVKTGKDSLFRYKHFSFMTETMKNASLVNNSSEVSTSTGTKSANSQTFYFGAQEAQVKNLYLFSVLKAMREFVEEEVNGNCFSEKRLISKIESARMLFPQDREKLCVPNEQRIWGGLHN